MTKSRSFYRFRTLFEPRIPPGQMCRRFPDLAAGIPSVDFEIYLSCLQQPVKEVAASYGRTPRQVYDVRVRVEHALDERVLRRYPVWAYSLLPFAIDLRLFAGRITRSEKYLRLITEVLPTSSMNEMDRGECLGFAWEHLGGILLHRNRPAAAAAAFKDANESYQELLRAEISQANKGDWKNRSFHVQLLRAEAKSMANCHKAALADVQPLYDEVLDLINQRKASPRRFQYPGHDFRLLAGEVQRAKGTILGRFGDLRNARASFRHSLKTMADTDVVELDSNQIVATLVKQAYALPSPAHALDQLQYARTIIDRHKERGVYTVFVDRARADALFRDRQFHLAQSIARRAVRSACHLGLDRQEQQLRCLLAAIARSK